MRRIHWQNLINFGVLPLTLADSKDYGELIQGDILRLDDLHGQLAAARMSAFICRGGTEIFTPATLYPARQIEILLAGGLINRVHE